MLVPDRRVPEERPSLPASGLLSGWQGPGLPSHMIRSAAEEAHPPSRGPRLGPSS